MRQWDGSVGAALVAKCRPYKLREKFHCPLSEGRILLRQSQRSYERILRLTQRNPFCLIRVLVQFEGG